MVGKKVERDELNQMHNCEGTANSRQHMSYYIDV